MTRNPLIHVMVAGLLNLALFAQNWPEFRGSGRTGITDAQNLPEQWTADSIDGVRWRTPIPGLAHSSPVIWGNRIFLTTAVREGSEGPEPGGPGEDGIESAADLTLHSWRLLAVSLQDGEIAWSTTAHEGIPKVKRHLKASHASQTPATDGKRIVALFGSEGLFCFDLDGTLLWRSDVGILDVGLWGQAESQWGPASSPIIYKNLVILQNDRQTDSLLAAFDLETGRQVWEVKRDEKPAWSTPLIYDGDRPELITNSANFLRAHDPLSGRELWRLANDDSEVPVPSPVFGDGVLVVTGGYPLGGRPIYGIRPGGTGDVGLAGAKEPGGAEFLLWKVERGSSYTPTPLIYRGILYVCADNGILSAYDVKSGRRLYRTRLSDGGGFSASPVASDGRIYLASEDGEVYVVRSGSEFELLARNDMGEALMATPAISGGTLVLRGRNHLYGIGKGSP